MKNWKDKISEHISYTEATKSITAIKNNIDNTPDKDTLKRMKYVAKKIFEPVREHFHVKIAVTSFFRSKKLNTKIGGSSTSEHVYGSAMDLDADIFGLISNQDIFNYIKENLDFNQLIWEFGTSKEPAYVHISCKEIGNKNQILKAYKEKDWTGKLVTKYKILKTNVIKSIVHDTVVQEKEDIKLEEKIDYVISLERKLINHLEEKILYELIIKELNKEIKDCKDGG